MMKKIIESYFFNNQNIISFINIKINFNINFHSFSSSQFALLQIFNFISIFLLYIISLSIISLKYLNLCFIIFSYILINFCENCEIYWIDYIKFDLIINIIYIKLLIILWYFFCFIRIFLIIILINLAFIKREIFIDLLFYISYHSRIIQLYSIWLIWIIFHFLSWWISISRKYLSFSRFFILYSFFNYILRILILIIFFSKIMRLFIYIIMIISIFLLI